LLGGDGSFVGSLDVNAAIASVTIGGATSDVAIKSLTIRGRVEFARVLGGFGPLTSVNNGTNGNATRRR
jgi:hypothetical protein